MPTKNDVFAKIIEHAPCKPKDLHFKVPVYAHLKNLIKIGWIKKTSNGYTPIKNHQTENCVRILKYCLKNGLNYNLFLQKYSGRLIKILSKNIPTLRPPEVQGNQDYGTFLNYLEENQFILITKKTPRNGIMLKHQLLQAILDLHQIKYTHETKKYITLYEKVMNLLAKPVNPFDNEVFSFLSGSAQLEGGTITVGETRELLVNDIYPDKSQKDIQMIKNLNEALHYILNKVHQEITTEHIKKVNELVLFSLHRNAGKFKTTHNKIQGNPSFKTAHPARVVELLNNYCKELHKIRERADCLRKIGYIHNEIQHIHAFSDGNSRTTRMIVNWMLMKHGFPILVIKMGCFDEYMNLTKLGQQRQDSKLTKLCHHLLVHESLIN